MLEDTATWCPCMHVGIHVNGAAAQLCCMWHQHAYPPPFCLVVCAACSLCLLAPLLLHTYQHPTCAKSDSCYGPSFRSCCRSNVLLDAQAGVCGVWHSCHVCGFRLGD